MPTHAINIMYVFCMLNKTEHKKVKIIIYLHGLVYQASTILHHYQTENLNFNYCTLEVIIYLVFGIGKKVVKQ